METVKWYALDGGPHEVCVSECLDLFDVSARTGLGEEEIVSLTQNGQFPLPGMCEGKTGLFWFEDEVNEWIWDQIVYALEQRRKQSSLS